MEAKKRLLSIYLDESSMKELYLLAGIKGMRCTAFGRSIIEAYLAGEGKKVIAEFKAVK